MCKISYRLLILNENTLSLYRDNTLHSTLYFRSVRIVKYYYQSYVTFDGSVSQISLPSTTKVLVITMCCDKRCCTANLESFLSVILSSNVTQSDGKMSYISPGSFTLELTMEDSFLYGSLTTQSNSYG